MNPLIANALAPFAPPQSEVHELSEEFLSKVGAAMHAYKLNDGYFKDKCHQAMVDQVRIQNLSEMFGGGLW